MSTSNWTKAGEAGVDAGIIMVGDPCYVVKADGEKKYDPFVSWDAFLEAVHTDERKGRAQLPHALGVVISDFGGDGTFPVYIERRGNQTVAAMIRFDGEKP